MARQAQDDLLSPSGGEGRIPGLGELVCGKYRVERVLGMGGMGAVLAARHEQLGQMVALKVLHPAACEDEEAILRFMREAQAAASLESDHVVRIFDVGTLEQGAPFMVMERLLGGDLGNILEERGPFPVEHAVECVYQASLGVADAHEAGIVHRDLKPSNLFLTRRRDGSAWVKVLDFGISKALSADEVEVHLTRTRNIVGSPLYMSPEQVRNAKQVDRRSDLWSLGVILHELLSGRPPFDGDSLPGVCARIAADPPARLEREDVPPGILEVLERCLQKDPANRYSSALELSESLAPFRPAVPPSFSLFADEELLREVSSGPGSLHRGGRPEAARAEPTLVLDQARAPDSSAASREPKTGNQRATLTSGVDPEERHTLLQSGSVPLRSASNGRKWQLALGAGLVFVAAIGAMLLARSAPKASPTAADLEQSRELPDTSPAAEARPEQTKVAVAGLRIHSTPAGAEVWQGEQNLGRTPVELTLPKGAAEEHRYEVRLDGYETLLLAQPPLERDTELHVQLRRLSPERGDAEKEAPPKGKTLVRPSSPPRSVPQAPAPAKAEPEGPANEDFGIRLKR